MRNQVLCEHVTIIRNPSKDPLPTNHCIHGALMKGETTGGDLPDQIFTNYCTTCGYPHLAGPIRLFKHHPAAVKFFDALQETINITSESATPADGHIKQVIGYTCTVCGSGFLTTPIEKFRNDSAALKFFKNVAKQIKKVIPHLGPGQKPDVLKEKPLPGRAATEEELHNN